MPTRSRSLSRRAFPLLLLGGGAGSTFLANIVARQALSVSAFVEWAYLSTILSIFFSVSLLGTEQLIIRNTALSEGRLVLPYRAALAILSSALGFAAAWLVILDGRILGYRFGLPALLALTCVGVIQVSYQVLRTEGRLGLAQLAMNLWKLLLLAAVSVLLLWKSDILSLRVVVLTALALGTLPSAVHLFTCRGRIKIDRGAVGQNVIVMPFVLALGTLTVLNTTDRVLVERLMGPEPFADYLYAVTLLVTPFGILASYTGFKEAVRYRTNYARSAVYRDAASAALVAAALVTVWSLGCFLLRDVVSLTFEPILWLLLGLIAVIRNAYAIASAAMGVRGSARAIYAANLITLVALVLLTSWGVIARPSLEAVVAGYGAAWGIRLAAYLVALPPAPSNPISVEAALA